MAVNTELSTHSYSPGSAMASEGIPFPFLQPADLRVTHIEAAGGARTLLTLNADFAIGGDGTAQAGTITATDAWAADDVWLIERVTELKQKASIPPGEPLPAAELTRTLDKAMMGTLENRRDIAANAARTQMVPIGETAPPLLPAAQRAGRYRAWDASGNEIAASGTGADAGLRTDLANGDGSLIRIAPGQSLKQWIASLLGSVGSALVGHTSAGTGATARTVQDKLRETVTPLDFGAKGSGISAPANSEHLGFEAALEAVRIPADSYFNGGVDTPSGNIFRLTQPIDLPPSFVNMQGDNGGVIWGASGQHVLRADGAAFVNSAISGVRTYGGQDAVHIGTSGEIATIKFTDITIGAFSGEGVYFAGGLTSSKITRLFVFGDSSVSGVNSGHGLHSNGGTNNNNVIADSDFTGLPNDVVAFENLTQALSIRNVRIEGNGKAGKSQFLLESPYAVHILGGWSEASHEYFLTTTGGDDTEAGVTIDQVTSIGSQYGGGGFVASKFNVGTKRLIFGSNIWSLPTTAPTNAFVFGVNKKLQVAASNVWTRDTHTSQHVTAARRSITSAPGLTFNLFSLSRGSIAATATNQQLIHVRLKLMIAGHNGGGTASAGVVTQDLVIWGSGATIADVVAGTAVTIGTLNGITATVSQGAKFSNTSSVQVAIANLNTTLANFVSYELEVVNLAGVEADGFVLSLS